MARLFSEDFLTLVVIGFVLAEPVSYLALSRWLVGFAYRIEIGPGVFLLGGRARDGSCGGDGELAEPRAARLDPGRTLQYE